MQGTLITELGLLNSHSTNNSTAFNNNFVSMKFCLNQQLAKFATSFNLSQVVYDVKFWLLRIGLRCIAPSVNTSLV